MLANRRIEFVIVLVAALLAVGAPAAVIEVGEHTLRPNTANQEVSVYVHGGDRVAGLNLFAQVGDGGPELSEFGFPAGTDAPGITSVDIKSNTIFASVIGEQDTQASIPQVAIASIEFSQPNASTSADGLLARLTIDTTGFTGGTWDLLLSQVLPSFHGGPFSTDFAGIPAVVRNGTISIGELVVGDFDGNGKVDVDDIDLLQAEMAGDRRDLRFDLNKNRNVDLADLSFLVNDVLKTWIGDANLDGEFNTTDLVEIFQAAEYEDEIPRNSTWAEGDWNGDQDFTTRDLVYAFQGAGFEQGPRAAMPVAEPTGLALIAIGIICAVRRRQ
jgi:hypothetical protein